MIAKNQPMPSMAIPPAAKTRLFLYFSFLTVTSSLFLLWCHMQVPAGYNSNQEWDVLIFTQHWPNTVCMDWEEKDPKKNTCRMPPENSTWTIHGIWPTKLGTIGPCFCNKSSHFNITQLSSIVNSLNQYWTDLEVPMPNNSFWKHEWEKHGTCSASLPTLDTELKYFEAGLSWLKEFNMHAVLEKGGVTPDSKIPTDLTSLWLAVKSTLKVNPSIHCVHDKKTNQWYVQELRICFDKSLQLIDCDGTKQNLRFKPLGNCPEEKPIMYPAAVPPVDRSPPPTLETPVSRMLKVIRMLMWFTL